MTDILTAVDLVATLPASCKPRGKNLALGGCCAAQTGAGRKRLFITVRFSLFSTRGDHAHESAWCCCLFVARRRRDRYNITRIVHGDVSNVRGRMLEGAVIDMAPARNVGVTNVILSHDACVINVDKKQWPRYIYASYKYYVQIYKSKTEDRLHK